MTPGPTSSLLTGLMAQPTLLTTGQSAPQTEQRYLQKKFRPPLPRYLDEQLYSGVLHPEDSTPVVKPLSEFYDTLSGPEADEFQKRAWRAFAQEPSIRLEEGGALTPANWLMSEMGREGSDVYQPPGTEVDPLDRVNQVYEHLAGKRAGDESIQQMAAAVLGKLREQSPGGTSEAFPGQTSEESSARSKPWQESRYQTSAGLDQNLKALRARNILSTFDETPENRPAWSGMDAGLLSIPAMVAGVADIPSMVLPGDATNQMGTGVRHLAYLRNVLSASNPADARLREALYWDRLADEGSKEGAYRDSLFGGYYPQYSWMTSAGMQNQSELDRANYLSRFEKGKDLLLSGMPAEQWEGLTHLANSLHREVPVVADSTTPEDAALMRKHLMDVFAQQEQRFVDEYPLYQRTWNDTLGQLPGMKVQNFSYPSPALNNVAMAPKYYLDATTMAMLGATLPAAVAQGSVGALGKGLAKNFVVDQPGEQSFAAAMYSAHPPYNTDFSKLFQPMENGTGNVRNSDGTPADPNDPEYQQRWQDYQDHRAKVIEYLLDYQRKHYPFE